MPYKDPRKKRGANQKWRRKAINEGYGKWLYERRKLRFDDAERFRQTLVLIANGHNKARELAQIALEESREAEETLGEFKKKLPKVPRKETVDEAIKRRVADEVGA